MKYKNVLGEEGALWNYGDNKADKPCEECVIVGMNAGLEYTDGTNANIDTGMWLHHVRNYLIEIKDYTQLTLRADGLVLGGPRANRCYLRVKHAA